MRILLGIFLGLLLLGGLALSPATTARAEPESQHHGTGVGTGHPGGGHHGWGAHNHAGWNGSVGWRGGWGAGVGFRNGFYGPGLGFPVALPYIAPPLVVPVSVPVPVAVPEPVAVPQTTYVPVAVTAPPEQAPPARCGC
jgi:hypothetical protein